MDRRSFLTRAAAIGAAAALPFQRVVQKVEEVVPAPPPLIPTGTRLVGYQGGVQMGYVGWVEELQSGMGNTVGWLTDTGVYRTIDQLRQMEVIGQ